MVFLFILIFLVVFLLGFSFYLDNHQHVKNDALVNSILILVTGTVIQIIVMLQPFYDSNTKFWTLIGKASTLMHAVFMVFVCMAYIQFPKFKKSVLFTLVKVVLFIVAFYLCFFKISEVAFTFEQGIQITSGVVIEGYDFTWNNLLQYAALYGLPLITILAMVTNVSNYKTKLSRRKLLINIVAIIAFELTHMLLTLATNYMPLFSVLYPVAYLVLIFGLYKSITTNILFDFKYVLQKVVQIVFVYLLPSLICGVGVVLLSGLREDYLAVFVVSVIILAILMVFFSYWAFKIISQKSNSMGASYEKQLEKDLASLDYDAGIDEVTGRLDMIFSTNVGATGISILMNHGANFETVYSSTGSNIEIPTDNPLFESLLNLNRSIVLKTHIENQYALSVVKDRMNKLFKDTKSEVCILFVEGHRLLGMMLLNEKRLGNMYTDYDYDVFKKLYSYFFLVGYYMHSVANESVVGTVNREIKMSDQIIHSIQENMDFIKNPKVDAGYLMVPAHNIGGEFIDFIRLTDDRHIFVLGAMSGKGITASMSMVILKSIIRTFLAETKDFKELVQKVNVFIRFNLPRGTFFAGVFALMDFKENVMYYINCGVPALFLYTLAYNNVIEIQGDGKVLGFAKNVEKLLKVKKIKLSPGDIVFACTEGLIESHSLRGEIFGKDRIQKSVVENMTYPADKIAQFTYQNLLAFTSKELEADITVLALKYIGNKAVSQPVEPAQVSE
ncbi:MAG: serine/threonine-protein phosphatase [Spirochaetaceae bacterium]|nr:serine/threonine-protein phosphatase [Spirochaetaceae bacterium]